MDSGDLGGLESILQSMHISSHPSDPETMFGIFKGVKGILTYVMNKVEDEYLQQTKYMDINMYIELPNTCYIEMDLPVQLNLPDIQPIRSDSGLIYLKTTCYSYDLDGTLVSPEGYIRCDGFRNYVNGKLEAALVSIPSGWSLRFVHGKHCHTQTIEAKSELVTVYMNIIPVLEFKDSQWPLVEPPVAAELRSKFPWFAVPWVNSVNNDNHAFTAYAPFWVTETLKGLPNCILFLNLVMTWHAKRAKDFPNFSPYMLKSFVLLHVLNNGQWDVGWDQLVEIMPELLEKINAGRLDSFIVDGQNMLECMSFGEIQQCLATFQDLYAKAPYNVPQFWTDLLGKLPDSTFWFSKYVAMYWK